MFSNSINSSLIGFARPNRVGEQASWSMATSVGDVGGGRGSGREVDRGEHVRLLSHGVDGTCIRQAPICVPADTTEVHNRSPFKEARRAGIRVSSRCISIRKHRDPHGPQCCVRLRLSVRSIDGPDSFDEIDTTPGRENVSNGDRALLRSVAPCLDGSLKEKQRLLLDDFARVRKLASNFEIVLARN